MFFCYFIMYRAASLMKRSTFCRSTLSGHSRFIAFSNTTAMEELFALSSTSHANKNISPDCSCLRLPTKTFAMNLPSTSLASFIETHILSFPTLFLNLLSLSS
jgi:hypothetical protein